MSKLRDFTLVKIFISEGQLLIIFCLHCQFLLHSAHVPGRVDHILQALADPDLHSQL